MHASSVEAWVCRSTLPTVLPVLCWNAQVYRSERRLCTILICADEETAGKQRVYNMKNRLSGAAVTAINLRSLS